jgi:streptogramin lyase
MKANNFWGIARSPGVNVGMIVRIGLALVTLSGSLALAWTLLSSHLGAYASGLVETPTSQEPWGVAFDTNGHIWVAEPACDPTPVCNPPLNSGLIGEFKTSDGSKVQEFSSSPSTFTPVFLAVDGSGNIWFTDSTNNAIGEFVPSGPSWQEFAGLTAGAQPYDLTFDGAGNIWFTERSGKIGFFSTSAKTYTENTFTCAACDPYGITYSSTKNTVWFAENGQAKVGSFTPTTNGTLGPGAITQTTVSNPPHLITLDKLGNVWYSEGFASNVGEIPGGSGTPTDFPVCAAPCSTFIGGIGADSTDTVWFNDASNKRIGALNPTTGVVTWTTITNGNHPQDGLAVDSANNVWFTDQYGHFLGEIPAGTTPPPSPTSTATGIPSPSPTTTSTPSPTPTPPPGNTPVSKQWFFGEGRVGAGFTEWLTLGNPTSNPCKVDIQYHYTSDGGVSNSKMLVVSVPANTRVTQLVNQDLGISATSGGNSVSTSVTVDTTATPQCSGIVAERPIYNTTFGNPLGVNSGTDVIGATHTGTSFYFADVRTNTQAGGGSVSSFIPILNPGTSTATVKATYFVGGQQVGQQQVLVVPPGTRGTIYPGRATPSLPARVAAHVTSDQQVLVERPSYFNQVRAGNAGTVSGEADVVGVQQPAPDFLFAEGYTGGSFQEDLVLANFDPTADINNATLLLEYANGATFSFQVKIAHQDQTTIDINQWTANPTAASGTCLTTPNCVTTHDVSMEVKTTGSLFVAERELFFHYSHNANGRSLSTTGVSDVTGQVGPAAATAYSFAEGYTNTGYDEWLTLQNPTASPETVTVNLANADGRTYSFPVQVGANTRSTVDITAMVIQHLIVPGDSFKGYEVSMSLSSTGAFVAERPMYFNASGYQGGDDQIGYTGG